MIILRNTASKLIKQRFKKIIRRYYALARTQKYLEISFAHRNDRESLIIYQMGKVGSSTIKASLKNLSLDMNIYHIHALTHERIHELEDIFKEASRVSGEIIVHDHLIESQYLRRRLDKNKERKRWKIITIVRDPIARNISSFFQAFNLLYPNLAKEYKDKKIIMGENINDLIKLFLEDFDHEMPLRWYDSYFKPVFDIDVYSNGFSTSKGYEIYNNDRVDVLLLRLENIDKCASLAFRDFLGINNFSLKNSNVSSQKHYNHIYEDFKKSIVLPHTYLKEMYSSKFVRHFFSDNEINKFHKKWEKPREYMEADSI